MAETSAAADPDTPEKTMLAAVDATASPPRT